MPLDVKGIFVISESVGDQIGRDLSGKKVTVKKVIELTAYRRINATNRALIKYFSQDGKKYVQISDINLTTNAKLSVEFAFDHKLSVQNEALIQAAGWFGINPQELKEIILAFEPRVR